MMMIMMLRKENTNSSILKIICFPSLLCPRHKAEADNIEKIAKEANHTSSQAYKLLLDTLAGENETVNDIGDLNRK